MATCSSRLARNSGGEHPQTLGGKMRGAVEWLRDRWGWMVTVASFILYFITIGVLYCYSLIFISLQDEFNSSATITGWIGSLAWAFSTLTSPLTALLLRCCQTRAVALLGILLCSSSLLITSFASNVYMLFAVFSVMYGMGINFTQHSTLCLIFTYFPNKNSTRTVSFALAGCQVGLLALNPLMAYFVATLGWRAALRIFSVIVLVPGVTSCIILLPPRKKVEEDSDLDLDHGEEVALKTTVLDEICEEKGSGDYKRCPSRESETCSNASSSSDRCRFDERGDGTPGASMRSMDKGEGSSPRKRVMCRCCSKLSEEEGRMLSDGDVSSRKGANYKDENPSGTEARMAKSPITYFFSLALATLSLAWTFFNVNMVSYTDSVGITANHGSILLTLLAGGEMVGKGLLSIFGDHIPFSKLYMIVICNILSAVISGCMIVASNFYTMISIAIGIGLMRAVFNTVPFGAGVEIFGTSRTAEASTLAMFSYGSGYLVGSVIPGGIYDITGSYTLSLVYMAGVFLLSSVMFLLIALRGRVQEFLSKGCLVLVGLRPKVLESGPSQTQCERCSCILDENEVYL